VGGRMKKVLTFLTFAGIFLCTPVYADICSVKPEAETKTNTLPEKYKELQKENEILKSELKFCQREKESTKEVVSSLQSKISKLIIEKRQIMNKLNSYPSKQELLNKIQELEEKLGR
jgi:predicted nuclease with TOPRIM domain